MLNFKFILAAFIFAIALIAGFLPFYRKRAAKQFDFPAGEAFASGIFLGAGLIHMLADSANGFTKAGIQYPFAFLLAGISFLTLLFLEHLGQARARHHTAVSNSVTLLMVLMLVIHSFLEGAAMGISDEFLTTLVLALAIIAHKWAASFALALEINKSTLSFKAGAIAFLVFAVMTPIGIFLGESISAHAGHASLLTPVFSALAAGTFLYIGTLHGLSRAVMVRQCCHFHTFAYMLCGFLLMALIALWT